MTVKWKHFYSCRDSENILSIYFFCILSLVAFCFRIVRKQGFSGGLIVALQCKGHRLYPWFGKIPHVPEQLSRCTATTEPTCCSYWSLSTRACALKQEKPLQWEVPTPQRRLAPTLSNRKKPVHRNKELLQSKYKINLKKK